MLAIVIHDDVIGIWFVTIPIHRRSCEWKCKLISEPAPINRRALNSAWVVIWKNVSLGRLKPSLVIIMPSCLRVDSAIIFFISHSVVALSPAINIVHTAIVKII